jgi:hypothetical protein
LFHVKVGKYGARHLALQDSAQQIRHRSQLFGGFHSADAFILCSDFDMFV